LRADNTSPNPGPLLAGVEVVVYGRAIGGHHVAVGVVIVGVGDGCGAVGEGSHAALAVVAVVAVGSAALLADQGQAVGVGHGRKGIGAGRRGVFGKHLRVAAGLSVSTK